MIFNDQPKLSEMLKNQMFDGYLMVRAAEQRTSSNGSKYLDMTLCDITQDVNAKLWDTFAVPPEVGEVIRLRGMLIEYNGKPQLRVDKMRAVTDQDVFDVNKLTPCAPYPAQEMMDEILNRVDAIADKEMKALVFQRLEDAGDRLMYFPAAQKLHHAEKSGLLHHTVTMLRGAKAVCELYPSLDADLLAAGVILHDLCKIDEMDSDKLGMVSEYTREGMLLGHLVMGVAELDRVGRELKVRGELLMMLEHMILSHHDLPEYGSPKHPMFPEAEVLHILDLLDARMFEMSQALSAAPEGGFTDRLWSLDNRKLYRRESRKQNDTAD